MFADFQIHSVSLIISKSRALISSFPSISTIYCFFSIPLSPLFPLSCYFPSLCHNFCIYSPFNSIKRLDLRTRRSPTYSDTYQISYWYSWVSWWWALECSKHVENWNKHTQKELCVKWSLNRIRKSKIKELLNVFVGARFKPSDL